MYGVNDYSITYPGTLPNDSPAVSFYFKVGTEENFGVAMPKFVHLPVHTWLLTNISSSPWTVFLLDNSPLPTSDMISIGGRMDIKVPAGNHLIEARFLPNKIYSL